MEAKEKETEDDIMNTLKQYFSSLDVPFNPNDIDRAHGVRLSHTDNHSGEVHDCQSLIMESSSTFL